MCILCVVSRWSRRIVTMLPWLVIPFIITWAFSQLLPPGYRIEVTSTRLACLGVLLSSLGWYEMLVPWLSSWRARRSAILRERRLIEAQEAAKWRKEATRKCRNCLTPYKIQSPGCGRFMCTYCGHISKRPFLEVPPSLFQTGGQGVHKILPWGGQLANGAHFKGSSISHNDTGCWSRPSERKNCWFGEGTCGSETCKAWQSFIKVLQCIGSLFSYLGFIWRKVTGAGKSTAESCRGFHKSKNDFASSHESRREKARKRANERRQARLERELLEAEEKKQREEVARMVEERRRHREEKLQVEKESEREAAAEREREVKKVRESERRRKEKVKERSGEHLKAKEQEMLFTDSAVTGCEQINADKFINAAADSSKTVKICAGIGCDQGPNIKVPVEIQSMPDSLKYGGNVKLRLRSAFKSGSACQKKGSWNNPKVDGRLLINKAGKDEFSNSSNSKTCDLKHDGEVSSFDSMWGKPPWFNAWAKGSEALKKHCTSSNSCFPNSVGGKLASNVKDGGNHFNNKAVGTKQVSSFGTNVGIQPPIAPPSTCTASLHQLFSSPTIFPPLELTTKLASHSEQTLQGTAKASLRPEHTFFEAPACATFHSSTGISALSPPAAPVQGSLLSSPQLKASVGNGAPNYLGVSQQSTIMGSMNFALFAKASDIPCSPMSPHTVCVPDSVISDVNMDLSPCLLPLSCLEKTDDRNEGSLERMWSVLAPCNREVHEQSEPTKDKDSDALQLPYISSVQSLFDAEILLSDSISLSPQKEGVVLGSDDSITYASQFFDRKSLWSDISALNPAVQIWVDADNQQKLPPEFVDCITQEIMKDPVITADGHSYERTAIETWLKLHDTSPKTGEVLPPPPGGAGVDKTLRPNHILRGQIIEYNEKLAKMQRNVMSWSKRSKDGEYLSTGTFGVLSF